MTCTAGVGPVSVRLGMGTAPLLVRRGVATGAFGGCFQLPRDAEQYPQLLGAGLRLAEGGLYGGGARYVGEWVRRSRHRGVLALSKDIVPRPHGTNLGARMGYFCPTFAPSASAPHRCYRGGCARAS